MKLKIGEHFTLAEERTDDVMAILGRRGKGKTTTAVVIVEELHAAGARFCVADPTGVWWGLKSSRNGKHPGIPCVVMGGEHQDVPLASESGEVIADFVADPASPSCVIDLKPFTQGEIVRFMTAFLSRLYHKNTHPLHLVLDEADQFAPQRPMPGEQAMLGAAQRVTKMGRSRGLHPLFITQRPATLAKNVLTQAGMLIAHAITGPQDRNAVDDWIKANANEDEREQFLKTLAEIPRGTAWFWNPDMKLFQQVAVRDRHTFDSSAAPDRGSTRVQPKALAEVDLETLKMRIAGTIERAKADDPRELRKKIAALEKEVHEKRQSIDGFKMTVARQAAAQPTKTREVAILKDAQIKRLESVVERMRDASASLLKVHARQVDQLSQRMQVVVSEAGILRDQLKIATAPAYQTRPTLPAVTTPRPAAAPRPPSNGSGGLSRMDLGILGALYRRGGTLSRAQLGVLCVARSDAGHFGNVLSGLKGNGYIVGDSGGFQITDTGRQFADTSDRDLPAEWSRKFSGLENEIFGHLLKVYPNTLSRAQLGELTGKRSDAGHFGNCISTLRGNGVVIGRSDALQASIELFS